MNSLIDKILKARKVGTPLVHVSTPDMPAMTLALADALKSDPAIGWDAARGIYPLNNAAQDAIARLALTQDDQLSSTRPDFAFSARIAGNLVQRSVVIAQGLQNYLKVPEVVQMVLNLRDPYAGDHRCLIVLAPQADLPVELRADMVALEDPLPDDLGYQAIVERLHEEAEMKVPTPERVAAAAMAVRGLSAFGAEQVLAMSLTKTGVDVESAWEHKRAAVNQIKGLTMTLDGPALEDVKGQDAIVEVYRDYFNGPNRPQAVVLLDEIEKMMAGAGNAGPGDNTGISQDFHAQMLTAMTDNGWTGSIIPGVPGTGKTLFASSIGRAFGVPMIRMDLGAMKGGIVGTSEQAIREAIRTIKSIGDGRVVFLGTCNKLEALSPEFMRRFRLPVFYFDTPTEDEATSLWSHYLAKYNVKGGLEPTALAQRFPGWTGAEVRNACELAWSLGTPVLKAAAYIVPLVQSAPESIEALRKLAEGRFISASTGAVYRRPVGVQARTGRKLEV